MSNYSSVSNTSDKNITDCHQCLQYANAQIKSYPKVRHTYIHLYYIVQCANAMISQQ